MNAAASRAARDPGAVEHAQPLPRKLGPVRGGAPEASKTLASVFIASSGVASAAVASALVASPASAMA
ncbi:MAG: hypothetical protein WCJ30_25430, partial [Deltaproteobacteria bacterium]